MKRARPAPPAGWLLWMAFLAAPVVWMLHFLVASSASEMLCLAAENGTLTTVFLVATLFAGALAASATVVAWRVSRWTRASEPRYDDFLPHAGWVMGLLVTFVVLAQLFPVVWLGCG